MSQFSRWLKRTLASGSPRRQKPLRHPARQPRRPSFDQLEDRVVPSNTGSVHLTDSTATIQEETHYTAKDLVWAYGQKLADGYYDVEVVAPGGKSGNADDVLGVSLNTAPVHVTSGQFDVGPNLVTGPQGTAFNVWFEVYQTGINGGTPGAQGYDDTTNNGGEYQVVVAKHDGSLDFINDVAKSKNFKVDQNATPGTTLTNTTFTLTYPDGQTTVTGPNDDGTLAPLGSTAQDSAGVVDGNGNLVTGGTVTFSFYSGDPDGTNQLLDTSNPVAVSNGIATDPTVEGPLGAGDYYFIATYTPDPNNNPNDLTPSTGDPEQFTIQAATPTLTTSIDAFYYSDGYTHENQNVGAGPLPLASEAHDSSSFSNTNSNFTIGGTVTYTLSGPKLTLLTPTGNWQANTAGTTWTETVTINGDGTVPETDTTPPLPAGNYVFQAAYNGEDPNYSSVGSDTEPFTIQPGDPNNGFLASVTTAIHLGADDSGGTTDVTGGWIAYGTNGPTVHDSATVASSFSPTFLAAHTYLEPSGTVHFTFSNGDSTNPDTALTASTTGSVVDPALVESNLAPGLYTYTAHYSGDGNYLGADASNVEQVRVNAPPIAANDTADCVNVGSTYSAPNTYAHGVLYNDSDPDSGPSALTAVLVTGPSHNAASPPFVLNSDGSFSYTPNATWAAAQPTGSHPTDSFTYKAYDGLDYSNVATVTLKIDRAPVAVADSVSTGMNVPASGNVMTNDSDPDGTLTAEQVKVSAVNGSSTNVGQTISLGSGSTLKLNADGTYTYTPGPDFHGSQSFTYTITDHCGLSSTTVTDTFTVTSGALTQGYWKTHQSAFDSVLAAHPNVAGLSSGGKLLIGGATYTSTEAIAIMNMSSGTGTSANAILILFQQLVAAKLNELNGVVGDAADNGAITDADAALKAATQAALGSSVTDFKLIGNKKGTLVWDANQNVTAFVAVSTTLGQRMVNDSNVLTAFNQTGS
jgi:VCBS repeat-containing protein